MTPKPCACCIARLAAYHLLITEGDIDLLRIIDRLDDVLQPDTSAERNELVMIAVSTPERLASLGVEECVEDARKLGMRRTQDLDALRRRLERAVDETGEMHGR